MEELTESIRERGVLLPILVRKTNDEEYEIISGHRRTHAARLAGIEKVPVIIRELSDDDATIVMVDSNIQREEILPSEKAYAFQMKLEAIQHKGIKGEESREVVGEANGLSGRQVSRYIKLTNLLPELLEMVDEKKIAIKLAVEIAELVQPQLFSQPVQPLFPAQQTSLKDRKRKLSRVQRLQYPGRNLSSIFLKIIQRQKWRT